MGPRPWRYPYLDDGPRLGRLVQRPIVSVSLVGRSVSVPVHALVDSGCEHVLAAPWLASDTGSDLERSHDELELEIGGQVVQTRFLDVEVRLHPPGGGDDEFVEWQAPIGFVSSWRPTFPVILGQVGFFDRFTVTMSRFSRAIAVEGADTFDHRFGISGPPG